MLTTARHRASHHRVSHRHLARLIVVSLVAALFAVTGPSSPASADVLAFRRIDATRDRACAESNDGRWFCWGKLYDGQLVGGAARYRYAAVPELVALPESRRVAQVSAGLDDTQCAVDTVGDAWCWGIGQLGAMYVTISTTPVRVEAASGVRFESVQAGYGIACGLSTVRDLWCWGDAASTGSGETEPTRTPLKVALPAGVTVETFQVSDGNPCIIASDGITYCWGTNGDGQLGLGYTSPASVLLPTPVRLPAGVSLVSVHPGLNRVCGIATDGAAYCWGDNYEGSFGDDTYSDSFLPRRMVVPGGEAVVDLATGSYHTCIITVSHATWCFGRGGQGELGTGTTLGGKTKRAPRLPVGVSLVSIEAANTHTLAIDSTGAIWVWGRTAGTQLGLDGSELALDPLPILPIGSPEVGPVTFDAVTPLGMTLTGTATMRGPGGRLEIQYSADPAFATFGRVVGSVSAPYALSTVSQTVTGLRPRTTYYARVVASNDYTAGQTVIGPVSQVTTTGDMPSVGDTSFAHVGGTSVGVRTLVSAGGLATTVTLDVSTDSVMAEIVASSQTQVATDAVDRPVDMSVAGLRPATRYYARVIATNQLGSSSSTVRAFTTIGEAPTIKSSSFSAGLSTIDASVIVRSGEVSTSVWLEVLPVDAGTDVSRLVTSPAQTVETGESALSFSVGGLSPRSKHWARLVAENLVGRVETDWVPLVTSGGVAVVDRPSIESVSASGASVGARFDTTGLATLVKLQVSSDSGFARDVTDLVVYYGSDSGTITRTVEAGGLESNRTYFVRVVGINAVGTAVSDPESFVTARPVGVVINGDADTTDSVDVTLGLTAPTGTIGVFVADNPAMARARLELLTPEMAYTLSASTESDVERWVYVSFVSSGLVMSPVYSDSIRLVSATSSVMSIATNAKPKVSASTKVQATSVRFSVTTRNAKANIVAVQTKVGKRVVTLRIRSSANGVYTVPLPANRPVSYVRLVDSQGRVTAWTKVKASRLT